MSSIKILVVSHKPCKFPAGSFYVPMHSGRADFLKKYNNKSFPELYNWMLVNTIGDDTGDNISDRNVNYCEWDVLYWAWKNYDKLDNPDYIGLMHYRRHFIFNEAYYYSKQLSLLEQAYGISYESFIDDKYQEKIGLNDANIEKYCDLYDIVTTLDSNFELIGSPSLRVDYEQNIEGSHVKDFDLMIEILKLNYPSYVNSLEMHINGVSKMCYGIFLMKRDIFFEYCEFVFSVLFELDKMLKFDDYSTNGKRTLGYLAEILYSVFIWKMEEDNIYKIKKLPVTHVYYPYSDEELNKIMSTSYLDYLKKKIIYIFTRDLSHKAKIKSEYKNVKRNLKVRDYYNRYVSK